MKYSRPAGTPSGSMGVQSATLDQREGCTSTAVRAVPRTDKACLAGPRAVRRTKDNVGRLDRGLKASFHTQSLEEQFPSTGQRDAGNRRKPASTSLVSRWFKTRLLEGRVDRIEGSSRTSPQPLKTIALRTTAPATNGGEARRHTMTQLTSRLRVTCCSN